jgi:hypothetical protein
MPFSLVLELRNKTGATVEGHDMGLDFRGGGCTPAKGDETDPLESSPNNSKPVTTASKYIQSRFRSIHFSMLGDKNKRARFIRIELIKNE